MTYQERAIARARAARAAELAPLREDVAGAIARVGWRTARPVVVAVMAPARVDGPRGHWWGRVGKRKGAKLLAALGTLPVPPAQLALPLASAQKASPSP